MRTLARPLAGLALLVGGGCTEALYPPRPAAIPGPPIADPPPSRVVVHATISAAALKRALDRAIPTVGGGSFPLLGGQRDYRWTRKALELATERGRVAIHAEVWGTVTLPVVGAQSFPIDLRVHAEPVVTADYQALLQDVDVQVTSSDVRLRAAQGFGGALDALRDQVAAKVKEFRYDLRPSMGEAYARIARPIDLPLGDARGCAELRVTSVEAGPTVLADGVEKDLAVVVTPSVTLPCAAPAEPRPLPPLANVAALPGGPFTVTVPIAARYEELAKAMTLAFTNGKLYFSKEFPELYMANPEVYAASDQLVLKLHLGGPIAKAGIHATLDGDIFLVGHPTVVDNELAVPDLQPTIETSSFLLKLKAALDGNSIRDQARQALRLDIGQRLQQVRAKLSSELAFAAGSGDDQGCLRSEVSRIEVTAVHPHGNYLRLYVQLTAQASVYLPCPGGPAPTETPISTGK